MTLSEPDNREHLSDCSYESLLSYESPSASSLLRELRAMWVGVWKFRYATVNFVVNGLRSRYRNSAEGYLKKMHVSKLIFPLATVSAETINFVLSLVAFSIIGIFLGLKLSTPLLLLPIIIANAFVFTFGLTLLLAIGTVYFRDLTHILQVLLNLLFYLIPILYPLNAILGAGLLVFRWTDRDLVYRL